MVPAHLSSGTLALDEAHHHAVWESCALMERRPEITPYKGLMALGLLRLFWRVPMSDSCEVVRTVCFVLLYMGCIKIKLPVSVVVNGRPWTRVGDGLTGVLRCGVGGESPQFCTATLRGR